MLLILSVHFICTFVLPLVVEICTTYQVYAYFYWLMLFNGSCYSAIIILVHHPDIKTKMLQLK